MPTTTAPDTMIDRLENASPLDPVVKTVRKIVKCALGPQPVRDALHGLWLGHPLHPMLTDIPIGTWTAAGVLDLLPGTGHASTTLIATGCAAAVPTAVTGWADWSQLHPPQQRVGLVHAVSNVIGLGLMGASVAARLRGRHVRGKGLAYAGLTAVMAGGYLGGHLVFRQAAGANHVADVPDLFPSGWQDLGPLTDLPDAAPAKRDGRRASTCSSYAVVSTSTCSPTNARTCPARCRTASSPSSRARAASCARGTGRRSGSPMAQQCTGPPRRRRTASSRRSRTAGCW